MISDALKTLGSWSITASEEMPFSVLDGISMYGHVVFVPGRVAGQRFDDSLLDLARYVGIIRNRTDRALGGIGMNGWLGDEDNKGDVFESPVSFVDATFANTIRGLLPAGGSVVEGTFYTIAGTYTGTHQWETPRAAIDYVCDAFGADWRVNNRGALDAGRTVDLFRYNPEAIIVRKGAGTDAHLVAVPGTIQSGIDAKDWSSDVVLLAEGADQTSIATARASNANNPYLDIHGNAVRRVRMISESTTSTENAGLRAQLQMNRFENPKRSVRLSSDEVDIEGDFEAGDYVWVYDPESGLYDLSNEMQFRGQYVYPVKIRVLGVSYPVKTGYTVAYRAPDGTWTDLTEYVVFEDGETTIDVGDEFSTALTSDAEAVHPRAAGDSTIPGVPPITAVTTASYQTATGETRARLNIAWTTPLNVDGSTIVDGDAYVVRYRVTGSNTSYQYAAVDWTLNSVTLWDLSNGVAYDLSVEAVDRIGNRSGFGPDSSWVASADTIPPSTPAAPSVAGNRLGIQVVHNLGKSTGGTFNLENDLAFIAIYASATTGFTPSTATYVGRISVDHSNLELGIPGIGTFQVDDGSNKFVRVTAIDQSGNESAPSSQVAATALLIDTINIKDASIQTAKIADLAVTSAKISSLSADKITTGTLSAVNIFVSSSGTIRSTNWVFGSAGWYVDGSGFAEFNNVNVRGHVEAGSGTFAGSLVAATGTFSGDLSAAGGTFRGNLQAAGGTFSGALSAASGSFAGDLSGSSLSIVYMNNGAVVQGSFFVNGDVHANSFTSDGPATLQNITTQTVSVLPFGNTSGTTLQIAHDSLDTTFIMQQEGGGQAWVNAYGFRHLGGGYQVGSDRNLKRNIADAPEVVGGLDAVRKMRFRKYDWKADGKADVGFVADELPEFVRSTDEDGHPTGWFLDRAVQVAIDAIKSLDARIDALEAKPKK